jgi:hypothetical protein
MLMQVPLTFIIWIATRFYFDLQRQMRWCRAELLLQSPPRFFFEEFTTTICRQTCLLLNLGGILAMAILIQCYIYWSEKKNQCAMNYWTVENVQRRSMQNKLCEPLGTLDTFEASHATKVQSQVILQARTRKIPSIIPFEGTNIQYPERICQSMPPSFPPTVSSLRTRE